MVQFVPMTPAEYEEFLKVTLVDYADSKTRAGLVTSSEALAQAKEEVAKILPQGAASPGHQFLTIRREDGLRVGSIWVAVPPARGPRGAYIYDLFVEPAHRRQGYAEAALRAAEGIALANGQTTIELNVFGFNSGAQELYRKVGYEVVATFMRKTLAPSGRVTDPSAK